jgi:hypothetical protein
VTVVETDGGVITSAGATGCTTDLNGQCNILTNHDGAAQAGSIVASSGGANSAPATINFLTAGATPTGVALSIANGATGTPSPVPPASADAFSDGNHYFLQETSGNADRYDGTASESIVQATLMNGGSALAAGAEPWAINWSIKNTNATNILYMDAVSNIASFAGASPVTNVICSSRSAPPSQGGSDTNSSPNCTPGSFDLDTASHFSNPANVGANHNDLGTNNNTLHFTQTILPGHTLSFTTYMVGSLNTVANQGAFVVLDSKSSHTATATVTAQAATDPAFASPFGSLIGSSVTTPSMLWLPQVTTGATVTSSLVASDATEPAEADNGNDWLVIKVSGVTELANFDEAGTETYSASGTSINEATFETDVAGGTFPTLTITGYRTGQGNALSTGVTVQPPPPKWGYWTVASDGGIFSFGDAGFHGSMGGKPLNAPMVGMAPSGSGNGYWTVASDGGIFSFGDARFFGSTGGMHLNAPIVGMAVKPDGNGYWLVASDGGIFSYGQATYLGGEGGVHLNQPIVGMDVTPDGGGYWLVAADGGIFAFGDAGFLGSMGGQHLNKPMVGIAATPDGGGYWTVASDGGIFSFGDAAGHFFGSMGGTPLNKPMVGMAETQL